MPRIRILTLTVLAMLAFAGNSLLCRLALRRTAIDPASFTSARILSGALVLWLLVRLVERQPNSATRQGTGQGTGQQTDTTPHSANWPSAAALFLYAATFSFAFVVLPAATGALLVFGAVQVTMIGWGLATGERPGPVQLLGFAIALCGLVFLLLPGLAAPPLASSALMFSGGVSWGIYSIRGKGIRRPIATTAGNFLRAAALALTLSLIRTLAHHPPSTPADGLLYAIASGVVTSGLGYAIWYTALPALSRTTAASVQLTVPVLAALGGVAFLHEALTVRLVMAGAAILSGVLLVTFQGQKAPASSHAVWQK